MPLTDQLFSSAALVEAANTTASCSPPSGLPQIILIKKLPSDITRELARCSQYGKPCALVTGKSHFIEIGGKKYPVDVRAEKVRREIYSGKGKTSPKWKFTGRASHSLRLWPITGTRGSNEALEKLKKSLAQADRDQEARVTTKADIPKKKELFSSSGKAKSSLVVPLSLKKPGSGSSSKLNSNSEGRDSDADGERGGNRSESYSFKKSTEAMVMASFKFSISHLLAAGPLTIKEIRKRVKEPRGGGWKANFVTVVRSIAEIVEGSEDTWKLKDRAYRELDIWRFPYENDSTRDRAIDNSIRVFDRQRISVDDPVWQQLLPQAERSKGKILSRLNFHTGMINCNGSLGNGVTVDKKTGLPKKAKKKVSEKGGTGTARNDKLPSTSTSTTTSTLPSTTASTFTSTHTSTSASGLSATPLSSSTLSSSSSSLSSASSAVAVTSTNESGSGLSALGSGTGVGGVKEKVRERVPNGGGVTKVGSTSGGMNCVNGSSNNHAERRNIVNGGEINGEGKANRWTTASPKPSSYSSEAVNRTPEKSVGNNGPSSMLKRKLVSTKGTGGGSGDGGNKMRKLVDSGELENGPVTGVKKNGNGGGNEGRKGRILSNMQAVELAAKFKSYYVSYEALYRRLATLKGRAPEGEVQRLLKMQKQLEGMKNDIWAGRNENDKAGE